MTLKESLIMYCMCYDKCDACPLVSACEKLHDPEDPYETVADFSDDMLKVLAYDAKHIAEKILFHLNNCEHTNEPTPF